MTELFVQIIRSEFYQGFVAGVLSTILVTVIYILKTD